MEFKTFKKYWQVFWQLQKINLMRRMAYPGSFLINIFTVLLTMLLSVLFINISFGYINNLAGWTYYQVLAVVGSYMIIEGIMWAIMSQLNPINRHIMEGTLDGVLLKPIDNQFFVSFWRGDLEDFVRVLTGTVALILAIKNTGGLNFGHLILFLILLMDGLLTLYSFNLMVRSLSMWIIDGSSLWLLIERITNNSQFPVDIYYNKIVRNILTFVIPLAFVATVPAKILTNVAIDWKFTGLSFLMMFIFFFGARAFWKFALKHYSSASS